jgi:IS5 family transposase
MPRQGSFSQAEYASKKKQTRRDKFLAEMEQVVPWPRLVTRLAPLYPKGERGRPPVPLERMLRIHFLQQWYALSDPGVEEALYDSEAMRRFVGIDLGREGAPDESTVLQFRHLLERHGLAKQILAEVNRYLAGHGMKLSRGTIVDATIIAAAPSTKNQKKARDPEMHQTKKGNQWHFGMKAHIGVDVDTGLVHTVTSTAANVADVVEVPKLLRGNETSIYGDAGYTGAEKRVKPKRGRDWFIAAKRSKVKGIEDAELRDLTEQIEHKKASVRARVEHPFRIVKRQFGYLKVRYRGLEKNGAQVMTLFALANLWMTRRRMLAAG